MRARPILFNGAMVRAILEGRKTQTRRVMVPQPPNGWFAESPDEVREAGDSATPRWLIERCPYGAPGARLWVRETWGIHTYGDETDWFRGSVRGAHANSLQAQYNLTYRADWRSAQEGCLWRPSIHMPRWASRITLEVIDVRVQRLQDVSEDDAQAEGVVLGGHPHHRSAFRELWESINGKRALWASNPLVWAVSFRRLP